MTISILLVILYLAIAWRFGKVIKRHLEAIGTEIKDEGDYGMLTYFALMWPVVLVIAAFAWIGKRVWNE